MVSFHERLKNMYFSRKEDIHPVRSSLSPFCTIRPALPPLLLPLLVVFHMLTGLSQCRYKCICLFSPSPRILRICLSVVLSLFSLSSVFWASFLIAPKRLFSFHEDCVLRAALCPRKSLSLLGSCTELGVDPRSSGY